MITLSILGILVVGFLWYVLTPRKKDEQGFKLWTFDENSWHARYYKWLLDDDLPQGGCAYFWCIVAITIFAPLIFTIYGIARIVMYIQKLIPKRKPKPVKEISYEEFEKKWAKEQRIQARNTKIAEIVGKILLGIIILGALVGLIVFLSRGRKSFISVGVLLGVVSVAFGAVYTILWLWKKGKIGKRIAKPFLYLGSVIHMIYTKSCPKITWQKTTDYDNADTPEHVPAD